MAADSSILAWRSQWTGEPGRLLSVGSYRARQDWRTLAQHSTCYTFPHCLVPAKVPLCPHLHRAEDKGT